jgi:hypothetical protein
MKSRGEQIIIEELSRRGLRAERFSKEEMKTGQTPDFRTYRGDEFAFYCEVKDINDADPLWNHTCEVAPGIKRAEQLKRGFIGDLAIADKIEKAVRQFSAVDPSRSQLRVVAFVNLHDRVYLDVLRELLYGAESARWEWTTDDARSRVERVRMEIDAYWWIERHDFPPRNGLLVMHQFDGPIFMQLQALLPNLPK